MKLYGLGGVGTGKLGNQVFAVKSGMQIVRQYQPVVANPNTAAQVETRSKLKLMSQVAAVVAPAIAIAPVANKTKRNLFISRNYASVSYNENTAAIELATMQLTKGTLAFVGVNASQEGTRISATLNEVPTTDIDKVAYCVVRQDANGGLAFVESKVIDRGNDNSFPFTSDSVTSVGNRYTVLAYGIRINSERAASKLGELTAPTAENIASIISSRSLTETDITLTQTSGASFVATQAQGPIDPGD